MKEKLTDIFNELCQVEYLYQTMLEVLEYCVGNEIHCGHLNELNDIISVKFRKAVNDLDYYIIGM